MMRFLRLPILAAFGCALAGALGAQTFPFQLVVLDQNQNATVVADAATLNLAANAPGNKVTITVDATYQGVNTVTLGAPTLVGSTEFSVGKLSATSLASGNMTSLPVTFTPTSSAQALAQLSIPFTETNAAGLPVSNGAITFALIGSAPQFVISYFLQSTQNVIPLSDGATLTFPPTLVGATSAAVVQIQNNGSAAGLINSVQVTGAAFQTTSVPLLPGTLAAAGVLQVGLVYTPTQAGMDKGTLTITFPDHTVTINLVGTGTAPIYTYQLIMNGQATNISPNQTLTFSSPPTTEEAFTITVQNTGTGNGTVGGISLSGQGYFAIDVPAAGATLLPGGIASYNFAFIPPYVGVFPGRLRIGNDVFSLAGTGTGSQLSYSFTIASTSTAVSPGGTVPFPSLQVGQSETGVFTVLNSGNTPATVVAIFIGAAASPFTISGLPSTPLTLAPGASASFNVTFTPNAVGLNSAMLQIDNAGFILAGSGNPLPALPNFTLSGGGGVTAPLQQPAIGLALQSPYSAAVTGTLTITQNPQGFSPDPSVQFSTGGATVAFTIPANSTQAIFPNNSNTIRLQTGSVANTITVTPSFATTGGLNLTPTNPSTLQFTVPALAPQLLDVAISQSAANGFTLQVAGLATSRSLSSLTFTFTPQTGYNLAATKVTVDVSSVATNWFSSSGSTPFGGQFLISAPFSLSSTGAASSSSSGATSAPAIQSVSVTATNAQGTSNAVTAQFQ